MRDGGRSASSPPVRVGSFFAAGASSPPVLFGSFLETSGDVAFPIGASSLFLSVVFRAPSGAFSSEGGFFFFAFFGFLSSNLRTSSFSFCFADDEFLRSLAFFLRCSCVDESVVQHRDARPLQESRSWVVYFPILSRFGRRGGTSYSVL